MKEEIIIKKRKTKLVITMGPALQDGGSLREALKLADAVRLNASHSKPEERTPVLKLIRKISDDLGRMIPVFLDLQGPKWRIGLLEAPIILEKDSIGVLYAAGTFAPKGSSMGGASAAPGVVHRRQGRPDMGAGRRGAET